METDAQGDTGPVSRISGQNPKPAKHMAIDILRFCGIFGFLKELLNARHTASFLGLFDAVPNQDVEVSFFIERKIISYNGKPTEAERIQRPGGRPEKVDHGKVTIRGECQVTDDGGNAKFVGSEHKANGNGNKPAERSFPGEAGLKLT